MKISPDRYAIDANVIVRYLLQDDLQHFQKAMSIMEGVEDGKLIVDLDPVNLAEVIWVLQSFYKRSAREIGTQLTDLLQHEGIMMPEKDRYLTALHRYMTDIPHFGDACACTKAIEQCEGKLFSFDRKLDKAPGVHRRERY